MVNGVNQEQEWANSTCYYIIVGQPYLRCPYTPYALFPLFEIWEQGSLAILQGACTIAQLHATENMCHDHGTHTEFVQSCIVFATLLLENSSLYIQFLYEIVESQEKKMEKFSSIWKSQTSRRVEQLREWKS